MTELLSPIAEILDAVAWPVCVVVIALLLRRPMVEMLSRAKTLDVKGVKFELREKLEMARQTADESDITRVFSTRPFTTRVESFEESAPVAGVADIPAPPDLLHAARESAIASDATVWLFTDESRKTAEMNAAQNPGLFLGSVFDEVTHVMRSIARRVEGRHVGNAEAFRVLVEKGILTDPMQQIFTQLQGARNIAVHSTNQSLTPAEAADWAGLALGLRQRMDQRAAMLNLTE